MFAMPSLFPDYQAFLVRFIESKGLIEAVPSTAMENISSPSIFFKIDPDGDI